MLIPLYRLSGTSPFPVGFFLLKPHSNNRFNQELTMDFSEQINDCLKEIKEENENFNTAQEPADQIEALKEMMDGFMQGAQTVREKIDSYNERRWQR